MIGAREPPLEDVANSEEDQILHIRPNEPHASVWTWTTRSWTMLAFYRFLSHQKDVYQTPQLNLWRDPTP